EGLMLGAIVGSTDAAAVFSVVGPKRIQEKVKITLEAESGANDPMAVFLTILTLNIIMGAVPSGWSLVGQLLWQGAIGLGVGVGLGCLVTWFVNRVEVGDDSLFQAFFLGSAFLVLQRGERAERFRHLGGLRLRRCGRQPVLPFERPRGPLS